ncbi:MAG TPA: J domain-containing protein [Candidatus Angelobacter sp.]|jgi:DnaJ-domain-containing protein 1|nr:J domain-containing protein [Candidatus Angelobacter sp.]
MPQVVRVQFDYYSVLEISPAADTAEVNAAFRRLAWRYHPDRNPAPGATLQFQDINEAHQMLSDPVRRAEYDAKWNPHHPGHRNSVRTPMRPHAHRSSRRRRRVRAVLLGLFAVLFVTSVWAMIFTALTLAHSGGFGELYSRSSPASAAPSGDCGFSMEMFPVIYVDEHGHSATAWEAEAHNCYGGSGRFLTGPELRQPRSVAMFVGASSGQER